MAKWQRQVLHNYGVVVPDGLSFDEMRGTLCDELEKLIATKRLSGLYECVLLDEAHDYTPREISLVRVLAKRVFAVADPKQKIYSTPECITTLCQNISSQHTLKFHYRIGRAICKVADHLAKDSAGYVPMEPTSNYDEIAAPSTAELTRCGAIDVQVSRAMEKLTAQLAAYPGELCGILCPTNAVLDEVWERVRPSPLGEYSMRHARDERPEFEPSTRILVSTIHSAKGLEFRAIHLIGAEHIERLSAVRNICFTAVTRAKTSLAVYHDAPIPGMLEQALVCAAPAPPPPTLRDAFGASSKKKG